MSKPLHGGPKLPKTLLDQIDGPGSSKGNRKDVSRKDRRKTERQQKKSAQTNQRHNTRDHDKISDRSRPKVVQPPSKPLKSILKRPDTQSATSDSDEDPEIPQPRVSRTVQQRLDEDDAEIAALEKKLGIKGTKSKALEDEGLDWLANGSDEEKQGSKRKRGDYDWLMSKRRKAAANEVEREDEESEDEEDEEQADMDSDMEGLQNPFSDDELSSDFGDFEFEDEKAAPPVKTKKKPRENPYVAPVAKAGKYVPPSLRRAAGQDEDLTQLKRQVQGQLNRLSEANFLSILSSIEGMYTNNARGHVTLTLIDLLMGLITSASTLSETFLILHSAFASAVYKVIGADFGAQLLEKITKAVSTLRAEQGKQVLNLLGFLANLYIMQLVGPTIVFDYIRGLLNELSEDNTELLLRIIRTAGIQLRQDDPTSLKDIVLLLTRSVSQVGESNLSVRTKFMIETINDLKNNKMKTGLSGSAIVTEHVVRMKKTLGTLNTRSLRASEPLQMSLSDLENSDKKGKWWLVGASYRDPTDQPKTHSIDDGYESETPGHVSLPKLAKAQGMNTDIRRAIFTAIMSATDYQDAHLRIMKLHLKNKQNLEVAKVLLHCAAAEKVYNPYYTIIARKLCSEPKFQKAMLSSLWDVLRKISSDVEDQLSTTAVVNLAKLFGTLITDDMISITSLKTLEFAMMPTLAHVFAEVLITTILLRAHKAKALEETLQLVFDQTSPRMVSRLQFFIRDVVSKAEITDSAQEKRAIQSRCAIADNVLSAAATAVASDIDDSDSE